MIIGLAGDVMLGRLVNEVINRHDILYPWGNTIDILKQHDLNLINLETTLTHSSFKVPKVFNFKATPDKVQCLSATNIHVVNLANNHILDYSLAGMKETIETLDKNGILHVGAGYNLFDACKPVIIKKQDVTIAIIGCTDNEPDWHADTDKPGTHYIDIEDSVSQDSLLQDIKKIKQEKDVDCLIVSLHWGPNQREIPSTEFQQFAHAMVNAGADIIHGHSAHVTQGIEIYQGKLILYDTGDFVDDYRVGPYLRNDWSFLYQVELGKEGLSELTLIPVIIGNCQVNVAMAPDYREMLTRMQMLSQQFNTTFEEREGKLIYKFL